MMITLAVALALQVSKTMKPDVAESSRPYAGQDGHPPEGAMHGLISIFDTVCNHAFPNDHRVERLGQVTGFRELTSQEVEAYLRGDPGRGWITSADGVSIIVTIEAPPFHTCAVRMPHTDGQIDEHQWRKVVTRIEAEEGGGFTPMTPQTIVRDGTRQTVLGDTKQLPNGSAEAFYLFRTTAIDPSKPSGSTVELRLVRQLSAIVSTR